MSSPPESDIESLLWREIAEQERTEKNSAKAKSATVRLEYPCDSSSTKRWFLMDVSPLEEGAGVVVDSHLSITKIKIAEELVAGEKTVMEMIATGAPLNTTLETIVRNVEAQSVGVFCSILLLDADGIHFRHGAAPSLAPEFAQAIEGSVIGCDGSA